MSKLSELAELLKSAKKSTIKQEIVEDVPVEHVSLPAVIEEQQVEVVAPIPEPSKQQPAPSSTIVTQLQKDIQNLKKMIEDAVRRQTAYQPTYSGGGADSTADINRPTRVVTSDYTPTTRDWYIGVGDRNEIITITLPTAIKNGREYVIKDETGIAQLVPIRIIGNIDNDPEGIEVRINFASVTLLYNNGWRII